MSHVLSTYKAVYEAVYGIIIYISETYWPGACPLVRFITLGVQQLFYNLL